MADAKVSKIGINSAVAAEEAAAPAVEATEAAAPAVEAVAPNISERRVSGRQEFPAPDGSVIVVTHN